MEPSTTADPHIVAVVGMAGRFPGARNVAEYWRNLCAGVESVTRYADRELLDAGEDPGLLRDPRYVRAGAPLAGVELFDASFFGFSPREAAILDPQHRHFLEVCWEALEDAGHVPESFSGAIGVFAGAGVHDYYTYHLAPNRRLMREVGPFLVRHTGNDKDFLTTRVSYCLNLTGPSITVQTACSTSLVAIHLAVQSLLNGECDLALAGGVTIQVPNGLGYVFQDGEILSPDGHCRAFDRDAGGTIFGSGAGVVVLRRAEDAFKDGDSVYALVRGTAVNNDGRGKVSYLAPSLDGQARCIAEALAIAGVPASSIGYVEAHGTGTPVGDPIEVAALTQAFGPEAAALRGCAIGSVKTNIGHLDTAAGVASFIKAALSLKHRVIPASLNFGAPNPACAFDQSPFHVNASSTTWEAGETPRRAGVNSLGVGGTNAHVVLEEAPPRAAGVAVADRAELLCLSARSPAALEAAAARLAGFLRANPASVLADVAHTLQVGRRSFAHRRTVVASSVVDAIRQLEGSRDRADARAPDTPPPVVFMFPGGGAQYPNMGRELYALEPVFRDHVDRVLSIVEADQGLELRRWLFPAEGDEERAACALEGAAHSLLATFTVEYALARLWLSRGIEPAALLGHSLGEVVAACVAGVMSLADALLVVAARGRVLDRLPRGATLAIGLSEQELTPFLGAGLSIAAVNGPRSCVVSGSLDDVSALESALAELDIDARRLRLAFAAHSRLLDGHLDEFAREIASVRLSPPTRPVISTARGAWADAAEITQLAYWVRQLRHTVRFSDGLSRVIEDHPGCVLLEVGPGTTLAALAAQHRGARPGTVVGSLRHPQDSTSDVEVLLSAVGRLWTAGVEVDWSRLRSTAARKVSLPTYPFEHARHWIERPTAGELATPARSPESDEGPGRLPSIDDWFSTPAWRPVEPARALATTGTCLVLDSDDALHARIRETLATRGERVIRVTRGHAYGVAADGGFVVRPGVRADYDRLLADLAAQGRRPSRVAHLWTCSSSPASESIDDVVDAAFFSLLFLAQAWSETDSDDRLHVAVITSGMQRVGTESVPHPERALTLGPCQVIPKECPALTCASIDWTGDGHRPDAVERLVDEVCAADSEPVVALRDQGRFVPSWRKVNLPKERRANVRSGGVYLITGGLGAIGLTLAEALARTPDVKLALLSRRPFPPQSEWAAWSGRTGSGDDTAAIIERLSAMAGRGTSIEVFTCDVTDERRVRTTVAAVLQRFGTLDGVVHAAGILDDCPFQLKERSAAQAVIAPKVHGTLALERAVGDLALDFFVVCSSTSTVLAAAGQVDYVAANAFLNAFAIARSGTARHASAIAWGAWADAGMALGAQASASCCEDAAARHPLLGRLVENTSTVRRYHARYDEARLWVLDQHRLANGTAVLPGSGFVELFRAAASDAAVSDPVQLRDVHMLVPLQATPGVTRDVRSTLERGLDGVEATVTSRVGDAWVEHARATIVEASGEARAASSSRIAIAEIRERCVESPVTADHQSPALQDRHLRFGPRWRALRSLHLGSGEALAWCELPAGFADDLEVWQAHPALVDLALHAGLPLVSSEVVRGDLFVPISIGAVRFDREVPARFVSHVRLSSNVLPAAEVISFDVTIAWEDGTVAVQFENVVLRRLDARARSAWTAKAVLERVGAGTRLARLVELGIRPHEGVEVFFRAATSAAPPCVVASPIDLSTMVTPTGSAPPRQPEATSPRLPRADSAPRDEYERALCEIWSEMLGVEDVGIHDNFFDLGGHSLIAVRLFTRIRKRYQVSLGLAVLFEAPTVAAFAARLRGQGAPPLEASAASPRVATPEGGVPMDVIRRSSCLVPIQPNGRKTPFFLFPGMGGNVLSFQPLVRFLAPDQPVIGLQSLGVTGDHQPLLTLTGIAEHFVREIRSVQPAGPYRLGGFSFGGVVGLEVAQQLRSAGERVELLALFDTLLEQAEATTASRGERLYRYLAFLRRRLVYHSRALANRDEPWLGYLQRKGRTIKRRLSTRMWRSAITVQEMLTHGDEDGDIDLIPALWRVTDANVHAVKRYVARRYSGPITLFRAADRGLPGPIDSDANWRQVAGDGLQVVDVPGNHLSMLEPPNVAVLGAALDDALRRAADPPPPESRPASVVLPFGSRSVAESALAEVNSRR